MAVHPIWIMCRSAHVHTNLLGFVAMMIDGVAYHVIPRPTGHPLHSRRLAGWYWRISNSGLALFVLGFVIAPHADAVTAVLLGVGGVFSARTASSTLCGVPSMPRIVSC